MSPIPKASRHSSSPRTSNELSSDQCSPVSTFTAISPEETRIIRSPGGGVRVVGKKPPSFILDPTLYQLPAYLKSPGIATLSAERGSSHDQYPADPFSSKAKGDQGPMDQRLSPTASSFTPVTAFTQHARAHGDDDPASKPSGIGFLNATSVPDINARKALGNPDFNDSSASAAGGVPMRRSTSSGLSQSEIFQAILVENVTVDEQTLLDRFGSAAAISPVLLDLPLGGIVYLAFTDMVEFEDALRKVRAMCPFARIHAIGTDTFAQKCTAIPPGASQALVKALFPEPIDNNTRASMEDMLPELLGNYGKLISYQNFATYEATQVTGIATFVEENGAEHAFRALNGLKLQGGVLAIKGSQFVIRPQTVHGHGNSSRSGSSGDSPVGPWFGAGVMNNYTPQSVGLQGVGLPSPTSPDPRQGQFSGYIPFGQTSRESNFQTPQQYVRQAGRFGPEYLTPVSFRCPDRSGASPYPYGGRPEPSPTTGYQWQVQPNGPSAIGQERGQFGSFQPSPVHLPPMQPGPVRPSPRRTQGRANGNHDYDYASGNHNVVDVGRIRQGLDVRTTIMLRNIPNKIDQAMLKSIVDETSAGKYDFMYLRIDFANNCNVGYAFINFEDPYFIIDFVQSRAGYRWNRFNSDKVAEVSYATIQGKDCLVQKFRNSSVMLEHPSFRPKIFHTEPSPVAGQEDVFPGPDNASKMRRSVENAEHLGKRLRSLLPSGIAHHWALGLFAPRAGQNGRDEQRRRRSQYDRGTHHAQMEEACSYGQEDPFSYKPFPYDPRNGPYGSNSF
ncbi:MAG: hypothetical protein M4579_003287 [Chaenotheca gracillima]|nr:MAG: hypothetical protein M4579_003287 [Chaenotheca gracillima]